MAERVSEESVRPAEAQKAAGGAEVSGKGAFRLAVFSGHSGGHLFPAISFSSAFKQAHPESRIELITSRRAQPFLAKTPADLFDRIHFVRDFPFPSGISLNLLRFLLKLPQAFFEAWSCLKAADPDLSVGFGSYVAYPGIVLSSFKKIPTLIHEQNLIPGKATSWLVRHASWVAVTFEPTFKSLGLKNRSVTGLPLRFQPAAGRPEGGQPFRILVVGGSQGSHRLNEIILDAFLRLTDEEKRAIAVNHITGAQDFEWVTASYEKLGVRYTTYPFFEKMNEFYAAADMAVTRAGASTLFELAMFGLPAIVVPYPFAGNHQIANAKYFESHEALILREESQLDADWLAEKIRLWMKDESARKHRSKKISELAVSDAPQRLVAAAEKLLMGKRRR